MRALTRSEVKTITGGLKDCILEDQVVKDNIVLRTILDRLEQEAKNSNGQIDYSPYLDCPSPPTKSSTADQRTFIPMLTA